MRNEKDWPDRVDRGDAVGSEAQDRAFADAREEAKSAPPAQVFAERAVSPTRWRIHCRSCDYRFYGIHTLESAERMARFDSRSAHSYTREAR